MIKLTFQCLFSPRLYKMYGNGTTEGVYEPKMLEKVSQQFITTARTIFNVVLYSSPLIYLFFTNREFSVLTDWKYLAPTVSGVGCLLAICFIMRSIGRASNPKYIEFLNIFNKPVTDQKAYIESLRKFDFDFNAWPTTFAMKPVEVPWFENRPFKQCSIPDLPIYLRIPIQLLAFIATHTFALRLIYPGTLGIVHTMLWPHLFQGRTELVEKYNGKRAKIVTADGNSIDTMFVDKRNEGEHGKTLVICSEGNSGFYEIGLMGCPIKAGYSALGWNHPGFAGSSGVPFPRQEQNAVDAVVQYAIQELGYDVEDIVLFGWSIGGYPSVWAAVNYPDIKGLILDATFDDLLPLAQNQMPKSWCLLVQEVVRSYVDLDVAGLLKKYSGPVKLIRRTEDEIICLRPGQLSTNCGNNLLLKLVMSRHADDIESIGEQAFIELYQKYIPLTEQQRAVLGRTVQGEKEKRTLQLISKYLIDFPSTHCTLLPEQNLVAIMSDIVRTKKRLE